MQPQALTWSYRESFVSQTAKRNLGDSGCTQTRLHSVSETDTLTRCI